MKLLQAKNLNIAIDTRDGRVEIVKQANFSIDKNETLGIVGESGCGKSITALGIMSLLPPQSIVSGQILLEDQDLLALAEDQMCRIRGNRIGMIFQEPMTALNPVQTIGFQIAEALTLHKQLNKEEIMARVEDLMDNVGLNVSRFPLNLYPHQLSGGQRQRVMIAMMIACRPDLLIADEPTTALDVTVQEQILDLINDLAQTYGMALIMISHDLGVIAQTTKKVMVMYAGTIMEKGRTADVFENMAHPYTYGLFASIPKSGSSQLEDKQPLYSIPGHVPDIREKLIGCPFAQRCFRAQETCRLNDPPPIDLGNGHEVWCFYPLVENKRNHAAG
jgi:peptide/nickel transport system ATP-binding protein